MKLLLLKYNNYYNRILKGYKNIDGYKLAVGTSGYTEVGGVNFNPRDGINTYHTVNTPFDFDYMLVFDDTEPYTIRSRWFAIDSHYDNALQRTVTLRRDVLYDYSGSYGTAPAFIEKGALQASDSAIYNHENMTFNQILNETSFLKDSSQNAWIVAYLAQGRTKDYLINLSKTESETTPPSKIWVYAKSQQCSDAPYDLLIIPPKGYGVSINGTLYNTTSGIVTPYDPFYVASKLSKALSSGGIIYDIQLLPYCPFVNDSRWSITSTKMSISSATEHVDYETGGDSLNSAIFLYAKSANLEMTLTKQYNYNLTTPLNVKIDSETRMLRLISPNSGTIFEFSPAKLGHRGTTNTISIKVKCTYKPYSPYIHLYPVFGGLYGYERTKENRGLICGGDFSLPLLDDKWAQYEIQNKNYMNAFNRQVENMEVQQDYQRVQQVLNIATGAIGGAVGGAMVGGVAGAVVGGVASVAGGIADFAMSEKLRTEALDYSKDMFGYNLQNIKALPVGLGRVGATVIDSFVFPAIETYIATDEETAALTTKIQWNGMTVGRIGTFNDFKSRASTTCRYIKAQIIRMADLHEELHTAKAISDELYKGVYIY